MTKLLALGALILGTLYSPAVLSESRPECFKGVTRVDICAKAKRAAAEVAPDLPTRISQNMTAESITALGPELGVRVRFDYDRHFLDATLARNGVSQADVKRAMVEQTKRGMCTGEDSPTAAFIFLGGVIRQFYVFADGEVFMETVIDRCN